ncbi:MAG: MFS transporter [Dehalococcoidia bacterium]|nr:MFS transporter [Dehalococcoidia bacterium]
MDFPKTSTRQRRPRIFYGWYIVAASVAMNFYLSLAFFQGFQIFFLPILTEFGWSRTVMSGAFSLRQLESGALAPLIGFLVDRWGPRTIITTGVLIGGAGMVMLSLINSVWMFYAAFLIISFGASGASHGITWPIVVSNWFRRLRGRALGISYLGPVVGGPFIVLVAYLEAALGWRMSVLLLGIGAWFVGVPLAMVARTRPEPYGYLPDGVALEEDHNQWSDHTSRVAAAQLQAEPIQGLTLKQAIRTRAFWYLVVILGFHGLGVNGIMVHQIPYFQSVGFSAQEAAVAVGMIFVLSGIGRLGAGSLMDYFDPRLVLAVVLAVQASSYFMLLLVQSFWQMVLFALLFGAAFGSTIPARPIMIRSLFGNRAFGAIQGAAQGAAVIMGVVGPLFLGAAYDLTGSYAPAIIVMGVITAAAIPLPILMGSTKTAITV